VARTRNQSARCEERHFRGGVTPRLYERARDILAARIEEGSLAPGERLFESRIAHGFGISRAPARQALADLEAMGLVSRADGHGYVVARPARRIRAHARRDVAQTGPLSAELTWERIYKDTERTIVALTAYSSWRVLEPRLAEYYNVSRTVAREVLARLQQRGVVKRSGTARWHAPSLTPEYVGQLYEMRWLLEPAALVAAAQRAPAAQVETLLANIRAATQNAERLDGAVLSALETELHADFLGLCANRVLLEAIQLYQSLLIAHDFLYRWAPRLFGPEPFLPEHLEIAEKLGAGHFSEAGKAMESHLRRSLDRAIARLAALKAGAMPSVPPYLDAL
jgi:DNA-binding GntR family transcriptional regulator